MCVSFECMYVYHMSKCLWRPEEGTAPTVSGVELWMRVMESAPRPSARAVRTLSPAPPVISQRGIHLGAVQLCGGAHQRPCLLDRENKIR